jgi:putative colanic acid biosynthesis acetyltransferase WcaF
MESVSIQPRIDLRAYDQSWYQRGRTMLVVAVWDLMQTFLIHLSPHGMFAWRRLLYRLFGAKIGNNVRMRKSVTCNYPWKLSIGDNSWIGDEVNLYCLERISIGANVVVSQQAYICTGSHDPTDPAFGLKVNPVQIKDGAWLAVGALVMPGLIIGEGALIGARAVLTKDAKPWTVYMGCPARPAGERKLQAQPVQSPSRRSPQVPIGIGSVGVPS